jgi:hypothetical protein
VDFEETVELCINKEKAEDKIYLVHLKGGVDFSGLSFDRGYSYRRDKDGLVKFPSAKALKSIKMNVKEGRLCGQRYQ